MRPDSVCGREYPENYVRYHAGKRPVTVPQADLVSCRKARPVIGLAFAIRCPILAGSLRGEDGG